MNRIRFLAGLALAAACAGAPLAAVEAQAPAGATTPKTVGRPQAPRVVPSMIVLNAKGAKLQDKKLVLEGVAPNAIIFADRPVRTAGHALTAHLLEEWSDKAPDSFARTPPNATVSVLVKGKAAVVDAVMVLKSPKLEGDRLTFDVDVLEGDLAGGDGAASVFMDIINLPIARRTGHRSAWYHSSSN
ncbi:MAG: hypothetical protein ACOY4R_06920 [Pseudomonadota bacterium]